MGSPRLATVGAFVLGGLLLFAVGLFLIGDRRLLFSEQFEVEADFANVAGVEIGTGVRLSGLPAGEVIGIEIPGEPGGRFVVRMRVREDLRALVRTRARRSGPIRRRPFFPTGSSARPTSSSAAAAGRRRSWQTAVRSRASTRWRSPT